MRQLIADLDYFVRYIELPWSIGGATTLNEDGTFNIYINTRLELPKQLEAFQHELVHCESGHLEDRADIPEEIKEWEAENLNPVIKFIN